LEDLVPGIFFKQLSDNGKYAAGYFLLPIFFWYWSNGLIPEEQSSPVKGNLG